MAPTPAKHAALGRRFLTDFVSAGEIDATSVGLADDEVGHNLGFGGRGDHEDVTTVGGRDPGAADVEIVESVARTDQSAGCGTASPTHRESLIDLGPTGWSVETGSSWFYRIENGPIGEIGFLPEGLGPLQELGDALRVPESTPDLSNRTPEPMTRSTPTQTDATLTGEPVETTTCSPGGTNDD